VTDSISENWARCQRPLWLVLAAGLLARLVLDVTTGSNGDIGNAHLVAHVLTTHPLTAYSFQHKPIYPYPPGWFPVLALTDKVSTATGVSFAVLDRLPIIAADMVTAWVVARWLADRGNSPRRCVTGAALIALNPLSAVVSGFHGQLDQAATCFAVLAVWLWQRRGPHRAVVAGLLIGTAAAMKIPPAIVGVALLVDCLNLREAAKLVGSMVVVPAVAVAPWLIKAPHAMYTQLHYQGLPGVGGLSIIVQRQFANLWLAGAPPHPSDALFRLELHAQRFTIGALVIGAVAVLITRPRPEVGAILMLLPLYFLAVNLSVHYVTWVLPFLAVAIAPLTLAAVEIVYLIPTTFVYFPGIQGELATTRSPWSTGVVQAVYVPTALALMLAAAIGFLVLLIGLWRERFLRPPIGSLTA
jgi:uncharacterized membrane protein